MRRKKGTLLPLEVSILQCGIDLATRSAPRFHGFAIAKEIKDREEAKLLTARGTLYRALDRLQKSGFLESEWEDQRLAVQESRPRRRLYRVTAAGEAALVRSRDATPQRAVAQERTGMATP